MPHTTDRAWWTVADAARLLRVNQNTLYAAIKADDFPHSKVGTYYRVPCEALRLRLAPGALARTYTLPDDTGQLELPLDVSCLVPVRRYRNTSEVIKAWDYDRALWGNHPITSPERATTAPSN